MAGAVKREEEEEREAEEEAGIGAASSAAELRAGRKRPEVAQGWPQAHTPGGSQGAEVMHCSHSIQCPECAVVLVVKVASTTGDTAAHFLHKHFDTLRRANSAQTS